MYEYDSNGLSFQKSSNWKRCLAIKDFNKDKDFGSWSQYWDFTLDVVSGHEEQWARTRYSVNKQQRLLRFLQKFPKNDDILNET